LNSFRDPLIYKPIGIYEAPTLCEVPWGNISALKEDVGDEVNTCKMAVPREIVFRF
jgi:hypothetical protein